MNRRSYCSLLAAILVLCTGTELSAQTSSASATQENEPAAGHVQVARVVAGTGVK
jgi:hypothetical protein